MATGKIENRKTFSIILATFNSGQKVENTLRSILAQSEELFELIVIDGASTDETLDCVKKYENRLTLISEKDHGVYYAFNKGIERASGKYLYFIGAGDCLHPNVLQQIETLLPAESESATLVYGDFYEVNQQILRGGEFSSANLTTGNICQQAIFYHRSIFEIIGKFDLRYKIFADWFFNFKCFISPHINKQYVPFLIADYEGGGISSEPHNDPAFRKDFPRFVREKMGVRLYLICKTFMFSPEIVIFGYEKGYAMRGRFHSLAKPYGRGYKYLRKTFGNRT